MYKIENLYADNKFESVVYYFKANGILYTDDLSSFDFNELLFIPGVTEDVIQDVVEIYRTYLSSNQKTSVVNSQNTAILNFQEHEKNQIEDVQIREPAEAQSQLPQSYDAPIADVYRNIPRSANFISYCKSNGKTQMSQLSSDDFAQAIHIKGLGSLSVKILKDTYYNFLNHPQITLSNINETIFIDENISEIRIERIFSSLPHGEAFICYCHNHEIKNALQLQDFSFDHITVKGIGTDSMEKLREAYSSALKKLPESTYLKPNLFNDIPQENHGLELRFLECYFEALDSIQILHANGYFFVDDICKKGISLYHYWLIHEALAKLKSPISHIFIEQINHLKESYRNSLMRKSQGDTLQRIADDMNITRERVRQLNAKAIQNLILFANMIASTLLFPDKSSFSFSDIETLFENSLYAECCKFILKESDEVVYLNFSDKFVRKELCPKNFYVELQRFIHDVIGEGLNYYDNLESIESQLDEYGLGILDYEDIMNYLVKTGYHFYGEYVIKGNQSYAMICRDAIVKFFPNGIKLDSNESNENMLKLRKIVARYYHGLVLPDNNRALTSRIVPLLILSDRGKYCAIESVIYDISLFKEVYQFIQTSPQTSLFYGEIFSQFKGRFLAETNITNRNFLHGMLKYLYPDDFSYERDMLVKNGGCRQNADDRICKLITEHKGPLTKTAIKKAIPGLNDFVIAFAVAKEPKLIQWDYNMYNHIDNISVDDNDIHNLENILKNEIAKFNGYLSESLLYNAIKIYLPEFLEKSGIRNSINLFYVIGYYFEKSYRFRRPHIISPEFSVREPSIINIAKVLLHYEDGINYQDYVALAQRFGWAEGTLYAVFSEIEKDCIRISENDYLPRSRFHIDNNVLFEFNKKISELLCDTNYFAINGIFNYDAFPPCSYEWNSFLIESIIADYNTGFKIISPQIKDRRYQRGIILPANCPIDSFEALIIYLVKKDGITKLTESELIKYLKTRGLITNLVPQELYECSLMPFKNEEFVFI